MFAGDAVSADESAGSPGAAVVQVTRPLERRARTAPPAFGTIVVVGGGCYGSYYLRQLGRAREAGALTWKQVVVVDRNPDCPAAVDPSHGANVAIHEWREFFADFLGAAAADPEGTRTDAIVPSPLMPHLLFDWVVDRARARWPHRRISTGGVDPVPGMPWQRASPDGATQYVSFAEWMCPINCIEPARCPATRGSRDWTMPSAIGAYVRSERAAGHNLAGPFVFHCTHRAYGVGMIDVSAVVDADRAIQELALAATADVLVGTMSHCHGALGRLQID